MARTRGVIHCEIWADEAFKALSPAAQRAYLLLLSQPDLSQCGVTALRFLRWALLAKDDSADGLRAAVGELVAARFVLVDHDTEELCVRTFIRNDGVYLNWKALTGAREALRQVASPAIRRVLAEELTRIDLTNVKEDSRGKVREILDQMRAALPSPDCQSDCQSVPDARDVPPSPCPAPSPAPSPTPAAEATDEDAKNAEQVRQARVRARLPLGPAWSDQRLTREVTQASEAIGATEADRAIVWKSLAAFATTTDAADGPSLFQHRLSLPSAQVAARRAAERRRVQRANDLQREAEARAAATPPTAAFQQVRAQLAPRTEIAA